MKRLPPARIVSNTESPRLPEPQGCSSSEKADGNHRYKGSLLTTTDSPWSHSDKSSFPWSRLKCAYGLEFNEQELSMPAVLTYTSRKCIVSDNSGRRWFIKEIPAVVSDEQALLSCSFQDYLAERTAISVAPLRCQDGNRIFKETDTRIIVYPFIHGESYKGRKIQSFNAARGLARLHAASLGFAAESQAADPIGGLIEFLACLGLSDSEQVVREELIKRARREIGASGVFDGGEWIHGDPSPFNVVFSEVGDCVAFTDFDNVARSNYMHDLAEFIITHCAISYQGPTSSFHRQLYRYIDRERASGIIEHYERAIGSGISVNMDRLAHGLRRVWLELMLLGVVRGDFPFEMALEFLDFGEQISQMVAY